MGNEKVFLESGVDRISKTIWPDGFINSVLCICEKISVKTIIEGTLHVLVQKSIF